MDAVLEILMRLSKIEALLDRLKTLDRPAAGGFNYWAMRGSASDRNLKIQNSQMLTTKKDINFLVVQVFS